jgi:hypothetical protein
MLTCLTLHCGYYYLFYKMLDIRLLQELSLHSMADDVATVKRAIDLVGGPVLLVAHSYG